MSEVHRKFLRVRIRNKGHRAVHKCEAELRVFIPKNDDPKNDDPMKYPSDDYKKLTWGRYPQDNDYSTSKDIQAHGTQLLHAAFSDSDFRTTPVQDAPMRLACISTIERLPMDERAEGAANNLTVPDSFSEGHYEVEIHITTDEGPHVKSRFKIYVENGSREEGWRNLRMKQIKFSKIRSMGRIIAHSLKRALTSIRAGVAILIFQVSYIKKLRPD
jgi:hypothetical protein